MREGVDRPASDREVLFTPTLTPTPSAMLRARMKARTKMISVGRLVVATLNCNGCGGDKSRETTVFEPEWYWRAAASVAPRGSASKVSVGNVSIAEFATQATTAFRFVDCPKGSNIYS